MHTETHLATSFLGQELPMKRDIAGNAHCCFIFLRFSFEVGVKEITVNESK